MKPSITALNEIAHLHALTTTHNVMQTIKLHYINKLSPLTNIEPNERLHQPRFNIKFNLRQRQAQDDRKS